MSQFEGWGVIGASAQISNASAAFSKALEVDPIEHQIGDTVFLAFRCDVTGIAYKPKVGAEDRLIRVHLLRATDAAQVDARTVIDAINAQQNRIRTAFEVRLGMLDGFADSP